MELLSSVVAGDSPQLLPAAKERQRNALSSSSPDVPAGSVFWSPWAEVFYFVILALVLILAGCRRRVTADGWRAKLPTAWAHLLLVECFSIYLADKSFHSLVVKVNAQVAMLEHNISTSQIESYYSDLYTWHHAYRTTVTFNSGLPLVFPDAWVRLQGVDIWWLLSVWMVRLAAYGLMLLVFLSLVRERIWSAEKGAYLYFSWHIKRTWWYRKLVWVMLIGSFGLPVVWVIQIFVYTSGGELQANLDVLGGSFFSGFALVSSLAHLYDPREKVHHWDSQEFKDATFNRSLQSLWYGNNASFGLKLVDSLWTAQNGDLSSLKRYVPAPGQAERLLEVCRQAQRGEAEERARRWRLANAGELRSRGQQLMPLEVGIPAEDGPAAEGTSIGAPHGVHTE